MEVEKVLLEAKRIDLIGDKASKKGDLAFGEISMRINAGEFIILFGPAGCGSSVMLRLLNGIMMPKKGEIIRNCTSALVSEESDLITTLSVLDNITLPLMLKGVPKKIRYKMAAEMLSGLGLYEKMYDLPQEISKKEQVVASIAKALMRDPDVIFLDDPVKKLGLASSKFVFDILNRLNLDKKKTIVVTSDDAEMFHYADRILFFKNGKMIKEGINERRPESFDVFDRVSLSVNNTDFARALSDHFLAFGDIDLKKRAEDLFIKRFEAKLSDGSLFELLKRSVMEGGVGLSENESQEALRRVGLILSEREILQKEQRRESVDIGELRKRVLIDCYRKLSMIQIVRLEESIERLFGRIVNTEQFKKILRLPEVQGGVGLSFGETKRISLKLNSFFGVK